MKIKKTFSLLLAFMMLFSSMPFASLAQSISAMDRAFAQEITDTDIEPVPTPRAESIITYAEAPDPSRGDICAAPAEHMRTVYSGTCGKNGDNLTWTLDTETGVLEISGTGEMADYTSSSYAPWYNYTSSITSAEIGSGVTSIGERAFFSLSNLVSVTFNNGLLDLGGSAFAYCTSLTKVDLPASVTSIGHGAFLSCSDLKSAVIRSGSIGNEAFYKCTSLENATLGSGVTNVWSNSFRENTSLSDIIVDADNPNYRSIGGVLYKKDGSTLLCCPAGKTEYAIPPFVTTIEMFAFLDCRLLTSVTLPDSITTIFSHAFESCSSLESVAIPKNVRYIFDYTFRNCSSLKSVDFPSGLIRIGRYAFDSCSSLDSVDLPDGLTTIEVCAFYNCSSLDSVDLPNGLTTIENGAFQNCSSLVSVNFPGSVTSIEGHVFSFCGSLSSANFFGAPPSSVGNYPFTQNASDFCIYYTPEYAYEWAPQGETTWRGYPIKLMASGTHNTLNPDMRYIGVYGLYTLGAIPGASICVTAADGTTVTAQTDNDGVAEIEIADYACYTVEISLKGYVTRTLDNVALPKGGIIELSLAKKVGNDGIAGVCYRTSAGASPVDLLINQIKLPTSDTSEFIIEVYSGLDPNVVKGYQIVAGGKVKSTSTDGRFVVSASDFEAGVPVWVRLVDEHGPRIAVKTGLRTYNTYGEIPTNTEFEVMKNKINFNVPESIPVIGGQPVSLDLGALPVVFYKKGDTLRIGIGTNNLFDPSNDAMFKQLKLSTLSENFKKSLSYLNAAHAGPASLGSAIRPSLQAFGYIEADLSTGAASGHLKIILSLKVGNDWQTLIIGIPAVVKCNFEIGFEQSTSVKFDLENYDIKINGEIKLNFPKISLSGGFGIVKLADFSVYGEASNIILFNDDTKYASASLKGEMGLSLKVLLLEHKHPLASGTFVYYEQYFKEGVDELASYDPYDSASYHVASRSYLKEQSGWLGGEAVRDLLAARQTVTLQQNIYGGAKPQMVTAGGRNVMVWLADDGTRSTGNHSTLVYSVQNPDGTWTAPLPVWDDGTGDFEPCIATDGTDIYVTWMDANAQFDESVTVEQLAAACEISAARLGEVNGVFGVVEAKRLTSNNVLDAMPCIVFENGAARIAWVRNDDNDILAFGGTNRVMVCAFSGTENELYTSDSPIVELSTGELNGMKLCWCLDTDGDVETLDDRELYVCGLNATPAALTNNDVNDGMPVFANVNGTNYLYFVSGNMLVRYDGSSVTEEEVEVTGNYDIVSDGADNAYLVQTVGLGESAQVFISRYADGSWNEAIVLTDTAGYAENPSAVVNEYGGLTAAYVRTDATVTEDDVITSSDLCVITMAPAHNMTLNSVEFDEEAAVPGEALPVTLSVTNNGELDESSVTVTVSANGVEPQSFVINEAVASGETKELTFMYTLPAAAVNGKFTFTVEAEDDFDTEDNSVERTVFYTDITVTLDKLVSGDAVAMLAVVSNNSDIPTDAVLTVHRNTTDGEVLAQLTLWNVEPHTLQTVLFNGDSFMDMLEGSDCIVVTVEATADEYMIGDNDAFIVVYEADTAEFVEPAEGMPGDVNGDGAISFTDVSVLYGYLLGLNSLSPECAANADVDGDGAVTFNDVGALYYFCLGA